MSLGPLGWLVVLSVPLGLGWLLLKALRCAVGANAPSQLGWAWCAGTWLLAVLLFVLAAAGFPPRMVALVPPLLLVGGALALAAFLRTRAPAGGPEAAVFGAPTKGLWVCLAIAGVLTLDRMVLSLALPIHASDEAHLWASRARVLLEAEGFGAAYGAELARRIAVPSGLVPFFVQHADYPHLGPLLQAWVYAVADRVTHMENRVPMEAFGLALLLLLGGALSGRVRWPIAGALVLLVAWSEPFAQGTQSAYSDLAVAAGWLMAVDGWLRAKALGDRRYWVVSALGLALALFAKHEGALLTVAFGLGVGAQWARDAWVQRQSGGFRLPRPSIHGLWFLAPLLSVGLVWWFNRHFGLENDLLSENPKGRPFWVLFLWQFAERGPAVLSHFAEHVLFSLRHSGGIPLALLLVVLARPMATFRGPMLAPVVAILAATCGYGVVFVGSPHHLGWHLETAAGRVLFQIVPVAALVLARLVDEAFSAWLADRRDRREGLDLP